MDYDTGSLPGYISERGENKKPNWDFVFEGGKMLCCETDAFPSAMTSLPGEAPAAFG